MYLTRVLERSFMDPSYAYVRGVTMDDLRVRVDQIAMGENTDVRRQLMRNGIEIIIGTALFVHAHTVLVHEARRGRTLNADYVLIATGSRPSRPESIPFDDKRVLDSDSILAISDIPKSLLIVGAGVIGCEYACLFATLGTKVTLIDKRTELLPFLDREIVEALQYHMRRDDVEFRLGEGVKKITKNHECVHAVLETGTNIGADIALYSVGRVGTTRLLDLDAAGVECSRRGLISVNEHFQTSVETIYAAGDVIGNPSLAATAIEQGRLASSHAFGLSVEHRPELIPTGIYTIPEISMVGFTEGELIKQGIAYMVGRSALHETTRGQILGEQTGILKLLVEQETRKVLGVHIIGMGAAELVHLGQAIMALGGTVDYFADSVFNYPTMSGESYKDAALNCVNKLHTAERCRGVTEDAGIEDEYLPIA